MPRLAPQPPEWKLVRIKRVGSAIVFHPDDAAAVFTFSLGDLEVSPESVAEMEDFLR